MAVRGWTSAQADGFAAILNAPREERAKPGLLTFEALLYSGGPAHAPNRVIGREYVRRRDLSAAIKWAAGRMLKGSGEFAGAHGFYVQVVKPGSHSAEIYAARTGREV